MRTFKSSICLLLPLALGGILTGCAGLDSASIRIMPMPEAYRVIVGEDGAKRPDSLQIPYATDRMVVKDGGKTHYGNERGRFVRAGFAEVDVVDPDSAASVATMIDVEETGILEGSVVPFDRVGREARTPAEASRLFARQLGERLKKSDATDLVIYVPGFKVEFPHAVLVPAMFQSFTRGNAVFAGYSWPSTPSLFAYFRDLESTGYSARNLRVFLQYLADETSVRRIHLLGYSAGTRLVVDALHEFSLMSPQGDKNRALKRLRIGQVVLVGSDLDRQQFGNYLADGLLNVPDAITVYMSDTDSALGFANFLFTRHRLGQLFDESEVEPRARRYLEKAGNLVLVDVTGSESSLKGNGHGYFRHSPWVSGDVLLTLLSELPPERRGLVREPGSLMWRFPENYSARLEALAAQ